MPGPTKIEWASDTWNPTTGCDRVSPGCDHCYALTLASRLKAMGAPAYQIDGDPRTSGPGFGLTPHPDRLDQPVRWQKPRMIFVNSMSDLFHVRVPNAYIRLVFDTMRRAPQHVFQILTKRAERMERVVSTYYLDLSMLRTEVGIVLPHPNCWLGVSVETPAYYSRIRHLQRTPAAVRFLSLEPLLAPLPDLPLDGIGWVIVGGESGAGARPMDMDWAREIRDQCVSAGVPFFFKQLGGVSNKRTGDEAVLDGRLWREMPLPVTSE